MTKLDEIMRQRNHEAFIQLLNRLRVAQHAEANIHTIQSNAVDVNEKKKKTIILLWAENQPVYT